MPDLRNDVWHGTKNNSNPRSHSNSIDEISILKSIDKHLVENQNVLNEINHNLCNAVKAQAIGDDISIERRFFRYMSERDFDFDLQYLQALRQGYTQNN